MNITPKTGIIAVIFLAITIIMATSTLAAITPIGNYTGGCDSQIGYDDNYIYCGSGNQLLKIDKTTISLEDSYTYAGGGDFTTYSRPTISGDYIYINIVDDYSIIRVNKNTMSLTNTYTMPDFAYAPIVYDGYVYALCANRYVYQLSASNLAYVDNAQVSSGYVEGTASYPAIIEPDPVGAPGVEVLFAGGSILQHNPLMVLTSYPGISGWVNTVPIFLNNYTYLGASSGWIYKFHWITGTLNASIRMPGGVDSLITDGTNIFAADESTIRKYDQTLTQQNSTSIATGNILQAPSGNIIAGIYSGTTYEIDPTDLSTISSIGIGTWKPMTLENETLYIPGSTMYIAGVSDCTALWSCDGYAACDAEDEQKCNSTTDSNMCGESYTGDYTEFTPLVCDYCTPSWSCYTYEACVSPAETADCVSATDSNSCSEAYTGNYSEFSPITCSYGGGSSGTNWPDDDDDDDDDQGEDNNDQGSAELPTSGDAPLLSIGGLSSEFDVNKQTIRDVLTIIAGIVLLVIIYYITKKKSSKRKKR